MANNASSFAALDEFLEELKRTEKIDAEAVKECSDALRAKIATNIAAQRDPYDHPWQPSKSGEPVLVGAMKSITVAPNGTVIEMSVTDVEARHHIGNARGYRGGSARLGGFRRALIPFKSLPGPFKAVLRETLVKRFRKNFKGGA